MNHRCLYKWFPRSSKLFSSDSSNLLKLVAELRNTTGMSLSMCRKAAIDSNLDLSEALEALKKFANSANLSCRDPGKEGLLSVYGDHKRLKVAKLTCDSDFVAMNQEIVDLSSKAAFMENSLLEESINLCRAKFKENIIITTFEYMAGFNQVLGHFIHPKINPMTGKALGVVILNYQLPATTTTAQDVANRLAKQLVACRNEKLSVDDFLNTEYMFDSVGTVKQFITKLSQSNNGVFTVSEIFSSSF